MLVHFIAILKDNFQTELMQKVDMFEPFKVVGVIKQMTVTYKEGIEVDYDRVKKLLDNFVTEAKKEKHFTPVFMHLTHIEGDDIVFLNVKQKVPYYRDPEVKVVSEGHRWYMLDDFIKLYVKDNG